MAKSFQILIGSLGELLYWLWDTCNITETHDNNIHISKPLQTIQLPVLSTRELDIRSGCTVKLAGM